MSAIRLRGATSGTTDVVAAAIAGDGVMTLPTGTGTLATAAYVDAAVAAGGKVLQVVSTVKTDTYSMSSATFATITGLTATITPASTDSKILVSVFIGALDASTWVQQFTRLVRDSTAIGVGAAAGSRTQASTHSRFSSGGATAFGAQSFQFLDSPASTSAIVYGLQVATVSGTLYINRNNGDADSASSGRTASTITVMEIGA